MAASSQGKRSQKPSIKYRCNPPDEALPDQTNFNREDYAPSSPVDEKQNTKKLEHRSSQILSTSDLISAMGRVWNSATRSLSTLQPKTSWKQNRDELLKENFISYTAVNRNNSACYSTRGQYVSLNLTNTSHSLSMLQNSLELLRHSQKLLFFKPSHGCQANSCTRRLHEGNKHIDSWQIDRLGSAEISYNLERIYGWMSSVKLLRLKNQVSSTTSLNMESNVCSIEGDKARPTSCCRPGNITSPSDELFAENCVFPSDLESVNSYSGQNKKPSLPIETYLTSLHSDFFLVEPLQVVELNGSRKSGSNLLADYHVLFLASDCHACEENQHEAYDLHENKRSQPKYVVTMDNFRMEDFGPPKQRNQPAFAKQEHALAGAMAGIFVSLCLHPVDTIKTIIQSCQADRESKLRTGRSIIYERGLTSLYRGIASNIASSAPISALYTFSYESVKGILLPCFSKEYQSFAHCMAGGCASVATSFIFTPSERIKQQMQVGSHYQSCWKALIGIIVKGGLTSLYTGWGAVLCRNVPHSIIKFYTYESLKQLMLPSLQSTSQINTLLSLVCGGLAGSTAALFTTPFDVVKTRFQTQIPGSVNHYKGVFSTLKEIGKREGLKGLYKGLTPRLVMYMTQGALFFASYESFKRLFSLEIPQLDEERSQANKTVDDFAISA